MSKASEGVSHASLFSTLSLFLGWSGCTAMRPGLAYVSKRSIN